MRRGVLSLHKGFVRPTFLKDCRGVFHLWSSSIAFSDARL